MKTLLITALLISSANASVFAYRQSASQSGNAALAFPSNNIAGNLIVVATSSTSVSAVNDTQSNTYSLMTTSYTGGPVQIQIWIALNIKSGANSVTATGLAAGGANSSIAILEYTAPSSFAFTAAQFVNTSSGPLSPPNGSGAPYQSPNETLLIIAAYDFHSPHAWTGTNLTVRQTTSEGGGQTLGIGDFDAASNTISTISTLNGCSSITSCIFSSLLNFQTGSGGASTPSASAFVGLQ